MSRCVFFIYQTLIVFNIFLPFTESILTFEPRVYDTYDLSNQTATLSENVTSLSTPSGTGEYSSIIMYTVQAHEVILYDLDIRRVGSVPRIFVDCYTVNDCKYAVTQRDIDILSLYGSMVNLLGGYGIPRFDLGLIRARHEGQTSGRFTVSADGRIAFWIRVKDNSHAEIYQQQDSLETTLSILELAAHERAHHEVPEAGHCDSFQSSYNVIINNAIKRVRDYEKLTYHIVGRWGYYYTVNDNASIIVVVIVFVFMVAVTAWCICSGEIDASAANSKSSAANSKSSAANSNSSDRTRRDLGNSPNMYTPCAQTDL